jgi:hypothetical protein
MRKTPDQIAALIIGKKARPAMERVDDFGEETGDDKMESLQFLAGDLMDALKDDDTAAFADALHAFIKSCTEGY